MKRFHRFCAHFNVPSPFPVTEHTMCCFTAYLADSGLAPQTVKVYLAAVRIMQLSLGLLDPRDQSSLPRLKRVLAGISRTRLNQHRHPPPPTSGSQLQVTCWRRFTPRWRSRVTRTRCSSGPSAVWPSLGSSASGSFWWKRQTSTGSPSWGDVAVDSITSPTILRVRLKRSKCDQFGKGVDVVVGRTRSPICPVTAVLKYIRVRQDEPGPFFVSRAKAPVTKAWLVQQVRHVLRSHGFPQEDYAGHSFRIGAATSAALAGIEDSTIQALSRWQSAAFLQYVWMPREQLAHISTRLLGAAMQSPS